MKVRRHLHLDEIITQRPKAMLSKIDRSKTAPSEQFFVKSIYNSANYRNRWFR